MSTVAPAPPPPTRLPDRPPAPRRRRALRLPPSGAPPRRPWGDIARTCAGMAVGIGAVAGLAELTGERLVSASLGATAVIIFALPGSPLAQPRAAIGGQTVAAISGVLVVALLGPTWVALALAGTLALGAMLATRTLHAPAGATALIAVLEDASATFVVVPVLAGTTILVLVALAVLRTRGGPRWPEYWW